MQTISFDRTQTASITADIRALILNAAKRGAQAIAPARQGRGKTPAAAPAAKKAKARPAAQFKPGKLHKLSADGHVEFMGISTSILSHIFKDGRIAGLLFEHALVAQFRNLSIVSDKSAPYDLIMTDAAPGFQRFEHKVATEANNGKADLSPSALKGSGRKYCRKKFIKRMQAIDGVILTDITNFPEVRVRSFSKADLYLMGYPRHLTVDAVVPKSKKK